MFREEHQLSQTSGNSRPSRVIFFDTETSPTILSLKKTQHDLRLGHAKYCRTRRGEVLKEQDSITFKTQQEFWDWVLTKPAIKEHTFLVSHNLNYDIPIMKTFSTLEAAGWHVMSFYTKGMVSVIRWEYYYPACQCHKLWLKTGGKKGKKPPNAKLTAIDNTNFFAGTLSSWGEPLGLPKLKTDFLGEDHQLIDYCIRDVEIIMHLWRLWFDFLDKHNCGNWKYTIGSTALNAFRSNYMSHYIKIHNQIPAINLERKSYKGGRVECFYKGLYEDQDFYLLDVNSMYPFVMSENQYPRELLSMHTKYPHKRLRDNIDNYSFIADCTINTQQPYFAHKVNNKTCYPVGQFRTTLTTPELQLCLDNNWLTKIHQIARYSKDNLFTDYVDHFYSTRMAYKENNQPLWVKLCKLMLNSLYGKFGQKGYEDILIGFGDMDDFEHIPTLVFETGEWVDRFHIAGTVIERIAKFEHWNSFPGIAAHVTAFARIHLYNLILSAGRENVYYCDTDSIIVNTAGYRKVYSQLDTTKLGQLKLETQSDFLEVHAPKDYRMSDRTKIKGIRKNATQISANVYQQERWPKLPGLLRSDSLDTYVVETIEKRLNREVTSGKVFSSSGRVLPYRLSEN